MIEKILRDEFQLQEQQVRQVLTLIDAGNTIPFIARYRKEQTGNMDDQTLRRVADRLEQLRDLGARRAEVTRLIGEQGLMNPLLAAALAGATTRAELDDLYRPFRPKRKTRASVARELGLQPLADLLLTQPPDERDLGRLADQLFQAQDQLTDVQAVWAGALDILAEQVSDDAWIRRRLRRLLQTDGRLETQARTKESTVYESYYHYSEAVRTVAGHRVLAMNRGEREQILSVRIVIAPEQAIAVIASRLISRPSNAEPWLRRVADDAWKRLLQPSLETEVRRELTEQAEEQAIRIFSANLRSLLMQPPVRGSRVLGLDPGYRTGCKVAVVDETGLVLDAGVIYPTPPLRQIERSEQQITAMIRQHRVDVIAIGNGTASRETELFVRDMVQKQNLSTRWFVVSEAGASVYSASERAALEFPDYDVSLRSAISIARRLQDPLAELVKIEPRSIGVGQYQHDIQSKRLDTALRGVVEDCVNQVGVDLNTASAALLSYVAGISQTVAGNIVAWREQNGPFAARSSLLSVPRLGPMAFQQSAGFLRIPGGCEILDNTSVHPESYEPVRRLGRLFGLAPSPGLAQAARRQDLAQLAARLDIGPLTLSDILDALEKPGRDPRDDLPQPTLRQDILDIADLKPGMILQGIVRNVADFGAFVDIGVHQDGLVHVSELSDNFVRHPLAIVKTGQAVKVRILQVDAPKKRISLSMKGLDKPAERM